MSLFTAKEQTLLVDTEAKRLEELDEEALADLLARVRRARKKYTDLDRRQSTAAIEASKRRSVSATSGERTLRKAEIFEDATSRVARFLSRAARANANSLKADRLAAAEREASRPPADPNATRSTGGAKRGTTNRDILPPARKGATSAANKRQQARKDTTRTPKR